MSIGYYTKRLFASMETSGDIKDDWLQLEEKTFNDLRDRLKAIPKSYRFGDIIDVKAGRKVLNKERYDEVAEAYIDSIMDAHGYPSVEEAALWSYRPGYYKDPKIRGDISRIPDAKTRNVMENRLKWLNKYKESEAGQFEKWAETYNVPNPYDKEYDFKKAYELGVRPLLYKEMPESMKKSVLEGVGEGEVSPFRPKVDYLWPNLNSKYNHDDTPQDNALRSFMVPTAPKLKKPIQTGGSDDGSNKVLGSTLGGNSSRIMASRAIPKSIEQSDAMEMG